MEKSDPIIVSFLKRFGALWAKNRFQAEALAPESPWQARFDEAPFADYAGTWLSKRKMTLAWKMPYVSCDLEGNLAYWL
ncbi:MAG: hypothetical protein LBF40_08550 [Deltaproteobacteria bacterium]|nr:hypothetical protein [Deltaproteobacteria bacterium]